jgi:hypothetical protein
MDGWMDRNRGNNTRWRTVSECIDATFFFGSFLGRETEKKSKKFTS